MQLQCSTKEKPTDKTLRQSIAQSLSIRKDELWHPYDPFLAVLPPMNYTLVLRKWQNSPSRMGPPKIYSSENFEIVAGGFF